MIKGRTPNIRTENLRAFANKLVASTDGRRSISKQKFNKLLEHAPVEYANKLRSGQKFMSTHQTKKFLGAFLQHIQEHPDYKVSTFARKALNVRLHQGDNVIQHFDPEHIGEKGLTFVAKTQQAADAAKNTGPTPEELKKLERRKQANILIGRSQRLRAEDGPKRTSGFANPLAKAADMSGRTTDAGSSATTRKGVQTSVAGDTKVAGTPTASTPIPGQTNPATGSAPRSAVQLTSLGGLGRLTTAPGRSVPSIGAPDTRGTTPTPAEPLTPSATTGGLAEKYTTEEGTAKPTESAPVNDKDTGTAKAADHVDDMAID